MEVFLVVLGAVIGAAASIAASLLAVRYQSQFERRERRATREEEAVRELLLRILPIESLSHRCLYVARAYLAEDGSEGPSREQALRALGADISKRFDELRAAWHDRLEIDVHEAHVVAAVAAWEGTMMGADFVDPMKYFPGMDLLLLADATAYHLRRVGLAYLRGEPTKGLGQPPKTWSLDEPCPHMTSVPESEPIFRD